MVHGVAERKDTPLVLQKLAKRSHLPPEEMEMVRETAGPQNRGHARAGNIFEVVDEGSG